MPSLVIRFSAEQAILVSIFWAGVSKGREMRTKAIRPAGPLLPWR